MATLVASCSSRTQLMTRRMSQAPWARVKIVFMTPE